MVGRLRKTAYAFADRVYVQAMKNKLKVTLALGAAAVLAGPQVAVAAPAGHTVSGVFTNDCGDGSVWVELRNSDNVPIGSESVPDGGTFTFDDVDDGDYTVVPYAPAGCGPTPYPGGAPVTVEGADVLGVAVGTVTVYSIWGVVTGCAAGEGNGLNGVRVDLDIDTDDLNYSATNTTKDIERDGQFFFQYLPATDGYTLTVTPPEGCQIADPTIEVDLSEDDVSDVSFALETVPSPPPGPSGSLGSLGPFGSVASFGSMASFGS